MSNLSLELRNQIYEAQQQALNRLLDGWERELEAAALAFQEQKRKLAAQAVEQQLESAAAERYLNGLVAQAAGGADITVSVPSGIRVATDLVSAAVDADFKALLNHSLGDPDLPNDQRSVLWALGNGMMPHPGDLATMMDRRGIDQPWADHLRELAVRLDGLGPKPLPQLQTQKLDVLHGVVGTLRSYPADRLLGLAVAPETLGGSVKSAGKEPPLNPRRVPPVVLATALDRLLAR